MNPRAFAKHSDPESILCRICNRSLRAITWTHLVKAHGFDPETAVTDYKNRFQIDSSKCQDLREVISQNARFYYERVGRHWTPERICREIRERARRDQPLNHDAVRKEAKALECAALRAFGSWDAALEASGLKPEDARLQRSWTRKSLRTAILAIVAEAGGLNSKVIEKHDPGLVQSARRLFGTWDFALLACGINPYEPGKWPAGRSGDSLIEKLG